MATLSAAPSRIPRPILVWASRVVRDRTTRLALVVGVAVGLLSLVLPAKYSSKAVVFPQLPTSPAGNLAGLAAQFGLANFAGTLTLSFYDDVISSPTVLDSLLIRHYFALSPDADATLLSDLGYTSGPLSKRLEKGRKKLSHYISTDDDEAAGLVTLTVTASSPALAVELADSALGIANRLTAKALVQQASIQREYLEGRLRDARQDLTDRENDLQRFYEDNRTYQQSPALVAREARLHREADMSRDLYISVRQQYDQARLSEARNVPSLSFIGAPTLPYKPDWPKPLLNGVLAALAVISLRLTWRQWRRTHHSESDLP
jgi:hypothetical protein